jgi:hypothetical protein
MAQPLSRIILATGAAAMAVLPLMAGSASAQQAGSYSDYPPPPPQQGYRAPPPPPGDQEERIRPAAGLLRSERAPRL